MNTKTIKLDEIKPAPYNPRIITQTQIQKLEKNLETFGLVDPIIINTKNNNIIAGHQRYKILSKQDPQKELTLIQLGNIGWVFEDREIIIPDTAAEKSLNLSLNRISGEFDNQKLNDLLVELQNENYDLDLTGFEDYEIIECSINNLELNLFDDDDNPQANTTSSTKHENLTGTIQFNTEAQRQLFLNFIEKLKAENPDKTISELLIEYIKNNTIPDHQKINNYTLIFDDIQQKQEYAALIKNLNKNKNYQTPPIIKLIGG